MQLNILQKQKQLEELAAQIACIQQEVRVLEEQNPEFTALVVSLQKSRTDLLLDIQCPISVNVPQLVSLQCGWRGVGEWPSVIGWNFEFDEHTSSFLEELLINRCGIESLFSTNHPSISKLSETLSVLDDAIAAHNGAVDEAFEKYGDETILQLHIPTHVQYH